MLSCVVYRFRIYLINCNVLFGFALLNKVANSQARFSLFMSTTCNNRMSMKNVTNSPDFTSLTLYSIWPCFEDKCCEIDWTEHSLH